MAGTKTFPYREVLPYNSELESYYVESLEYILKQLEKAEQEGDLRGVFGQDVATEATFWTKELRALLKLKPGSVGLNSRMRLTKWLFNATMTATEPSVADRFASSACLLWKSHPGSLLVAHPSLEFDPAYRNMIDWPKLVAATTKLLAVDPSSFLGDGNHVHHALAKLSHTFAATQVDDATSLQRLAFESILPFMGPEIDATAVVRALGIALPLPPQAGQDLATEILPQLFHLWRLVPPNVGDHELLPLFAKVAGVATHSPKTTFDSYGIFTKDQMSVLFAAILRIIQIPLPGAQDIGSAAKRTHRQARAVKSFAHIVAYSLTPEVLEKLTTLINTIESFCHPSNSGHYTITIIEFIKELAEAVCFRLNHGDPNDIHPIDAELASPVAKILLGPLLMGIQARNPATFGMSLIALQDLSAVSPDVVVPQILQQAYSALQGGNQHETHRIVAALGSLAHIVKLLVQHSKWRLHVSTLFELALPHVDVNSPHKAVIALTFMHAVAMAMPLGGSDDVYLAVQYVPLAVRALELHEDAPTDLDETLADQVALSSTASFAEVVPALFDRILELLDTLPGEPEKVSGSNSSSSANLDTASYTAGGRGNNASLALLGSESTLLHTAPIAASAVAAAVDAPVFDRLSNILIEKLGESNSTDAFAQLCGGVVRVNPPKLWPKIWISVAGAIRREITENEAGRGRSRSPQDRTLVRLLGVLNMCIWASGQVILECSEELAEFLVYLRDNTRHSVVYNVANTVHHAITTLLTTYARPLGPSRDLLWGTSPQNISRIEWHVPNGNAVNFAIKLYSDHIALSERKIIEHGVASGGDVIPDNLVFVRTATAAAALLFDPMAGANSDHAYIPASYPTSLLKDNATISRELSNIRLRTINLLQLVYQELGSDDISCLKELLFAVKVWIADVGYESTVRVESLQSGLYAYESRLFRVPGLRKEFPLGVLVRRANVYHAQRIAYNYSLRGGRTPSEKELEVVQKLILDACFSAYPSVRRNAYSALYNAGRAFKPRTAIETVYPLILRKTLELTEEKQYDRAEGGLGVFNYRSIASCIRKDYRHIQLFFDMICNATSADNYRLNQASMILFSSCVSALRLPIDPYLDSEPVTPERHNSSLALLELADELPKYPISELNWKLGVVCSAVLVALSQSSQLPLRESTLAALTNGLTAKHPDVRRTCIHGLLLAHQTVLRTGLVADGKKYKHFMIGDSTEPLARCEVSIDNANMPSSDDFFDGLSFIYASRNDGISNSALTEGWLLWPRDNRVWGLHRSTIADGLLQYSPEDERNVKSYSRVLTAEFWENLIAILQVEPRPNEDKVDRRMESIVRNIVIFTSHGLAAANMDDLTRLSLFQNIDTDDRNWHRVAAEFCSGLLQSMPLVVEPSQVEDLVVSVVSAAFTALAPENIGYWSAFVKHAFSAIDHRRAPKVVSLIDSAVTNIRPESGARDGLRLSLYSDFVLTKFWRQQIPDITSLWDNIGHELQTVREEIAEALAVILATRIRSPFLDVGSFLACGASSERLGLQASDSDRLVACFETADISGSKTLVSVLNRLFRLSCGTVVTELLLRGVMTSLLKLSLYRDDPELLLELNKLFSYIRSVPFSRRQLPAAMEMLRTLFVNSESGWHQKIRLLMFIQGFFFTHMFVLTESQLVDLASLIRTAIRDNQAEVRSMAADTLGGIVRCSPPQNREKIVQDLISSLTMDLLSSKERIERHSAVLGLGAVVNAFPYVSPPPKWVPAVLATLANRAADDTGIVGNTVKQILGDFKKTRQDTWPVDQSVFSQDELDSLEGVLWKNYFA